MNDLSDGFDLGARLKALRDSHGMSQRELAKRAGVSNAIISMIEQNRSSPSVGMLKKLLDGFPMSLAEFFADDLKPRPQIFFAASELVELAGGAVSYRQVGKDMTGKAIQLMHERYQPGADTGGQMLSHEAEEGGVIIRGRLEVTVGDQVRVLGPGDAYYFDSRIPHRFRNVGTEECEVVTANSPPSF
ncbi:XRE family transcriptional regulator [Dongia mobilis]|uniref:XRE family transcriptional regulator n=1 Tax=Dongia mobilis TaxID=578943 RepID=A0A4R6WKQ9_9PROT|nr:cupin domain-containing protein [Dongia mobilis]TDQ81017.1 XRE family transcriptional regulator [Dongia mobilis]